MPIFATPILLKKTRCLYHLTFITQIFVYIVSLIRIPYRSMSTAICDDDIVRNIFDLTCKVAVTCTLFLPCGRTSYDYIGDETILSWFYGFMTPRCPHEETFGPNLPIAKFWVVDDDNGGLPIR